MRFRPLCIDYHAEALHMEEEQRRLSGEKRPVIWIRTIKNHIRGESNNGNKDNTNIKPLDQCDVPCIDSIEQRACNTQEISLDQQQLIVTNDDQAFVTITPTPIKKEQQDLTESINREEGKNFVAIFKPPPAYTEWLSYDSVSRFARCSSF
jgi:hypothetical protein